MLVWPEHKLETHDDRFWHSTVQLAMATGERLGVIRTNWVRFGWTRHGWTYARFDLGTEAGDLGCGQRPKSGRFT